MEKNSSLGTPPLQQAILVRWLLLAALAYLVNLFPVTLSFGIHYLFGGIFALVGAYWMGPWAGMALALVAGVPSLSLWGHPLALVIMVAEAGLVGLAVRRRWLSPVGVGLLFWVLLGIPVVLWSYQGLLGIELQGALAVALKQAVNGIFNIAIASLLVHWLDRGERQVPLYLFLVRTLTPLILLPVLVSTVLTAQRTEEALRTEVQNQVLQARAIVADNVEAWVAHHREGVRYLARAVVPYLDDPAAMTQMIAVVTQQHQGFHGMYFGDSRGRLVAMHIQRPFPVAVGDDYSSRQYYKDLIATRRGAVSNIFPGMGTANNEPIAGITEPVLLPGGELGGYIFGALSPSDGNQVLERLHEAMGLDVVVTDRAGRVVVSTLREFPPLSQYTQPEGRAVQVLPGGSYVQLADASAALVRASSMVFISQTTLAQTGWTVHVIQPLSEMQNQIHRSHTRAFLLGLGATAVLLATLGWSLRGVTRPLAHLAAIRVTGGAALLIPAVAHSPIEEVRRLQSHMTEVALQLDEANQRLAHQAEHDALTGLKNAGVFWVELDERIRQGAPFSLMMMDLDGFKRFNDLNGHVAGNRYLQWMAGGGDRIVSRWGGLLCRYGGDEFSALLPILLPHEERQLADELLAMIAAAPLPSGGGLFRPGLSIGFARFPDDGASARDLVQRADMALYGVKRKDRVGTRWFQAVIRLLESPVDPQRLARLEPILTVLHDKLPWLHAHSVRVSRLAVAVGEELGLTGCELRRLELAALLHDIGKVDVPRAIVTQLRPLQPEERLLLQGHSAWGADLLDEILGDPLVAAVARYHHERYDGQGYPEGLAGEAIPLGARIVAAVDAYDAMTGDRPYNGPPLQGSAAAELQAQAGGQFDPQVVDRLVRVLRTQNAR